jgi:hypothetical protein
VKKEAHEGPPFALIGWLAMTVPDGCDTSTTSPEFTVRNSKLPPGGGRAAAGGSTRRRRTTPAPQPSQSKQTVWVAVLKLGGADSRYALQVGKRVTYVDGATTLDDVLAFLKPRGGRSGDET